MEEEKRYLNFTKVLMEKFFEEAEGKEYLDSFIKGLKFGIKLAEGKEKDFAFCYGAILGYLLGKKKFGENKNYENLNES
ncbi:MAG: hypothetical protein QXQ69_00610 [Candidatus Aenigmatarchaeota archaeon]